MKTLISFFVFFTVMLFSVPINATDIEEKASGYKQPQDGKVIIGMDKDFFLSKRISFSVRPPRKWLKYTFYPSHSKDVIAYFKSTGQLVPGIGIGLLPADVGVEKAIIFAEHYKQKYFYPGTIEGPFEEQFNGLSAARMRVGIKNGTFKGERYFFLHNGVVIELSYEAESFYFDRDYSTFKEFVHSFMLEEYE